MCSTVVTDHVTKSHVPCQVFVNSANSSNHLDLLLLLKLIVGEKGSKATVAVVFTYKIHKVKKSFQIFCGTLNYHKNSVRLFHVREHSFFRRGVGRRNSREGH